MSNPSINRAALLQAAMLVRPALAVQSYIPILTNIRLQENGMLAFNDVLSVYVKMEMGETGCVPGELFIKALSSFNTRDVLLNVNGSEMLLVSGRSRVKLPLGDAADFPYKTPKGSVIAEVDLTASMITGIDHCLTTAGKDPTHPAQMGVTLDTVGGKAVMYSTDNYTISRYRTKAKLELPGDAPVVLPAGFCEQVLAMAKAFPEEELTLSVFADYLKLEVGKRAVVTSKLLADVEPLEFTKIIDKYIAAEEGHFFEMPDTFDAAFDRAVLIMSAATDKTTKVSLDRGVVNLETRSDLGEATDRLDLDGVKVADPFHVDPGLVIRGAKLCTHIAFYRRVLVLGTSDGTYTQLIAHCSA